MNNGGFEEKYNCTNPYLFNALNWDEIDNNSGCLYCNSCFSSLGGVPVNGFGFQYPRTGHAYVIADFFCLNCNINSRRTYARNKLRSTLQSNKVYCVKFYVNVGNWSTYGIDGVGAYFGDSSLDTITKAHKILSYLNPQVKNPDNNFITDTLGWVAVTGTFVATGSEKYMVIGNFKTDAATNTVIIQTTYPNNKGCTMSIDDVSCIPIDLPAFAGNDTTCIPGSTIYLGRPRDVGIDEACKWYKLPIVITPTTPALDTAAGIFVSPIVTSTYVVMQEICGIIKYDTVVVYQDAVGLEKLKLLSEELKIYPTPAQNFIQLQISNQELLTVFNTVSIFNSLGQLIRKEDFTVHESKSKIKTNDLESGVYFLQLNSNINETVRKRFVISR